MSSDIPQGHNHVSSGVKCGESKLLNHKTSEANNKIVKIWGGIERAAANALASRHPYRHTCATTTQ
jgi:hypothetical protein